MKTHYVTPEQEHDMFSLRYWDTKEVIVEGRLIGLSDFYREFCASHQDINPGPATLRHQGQHCGFINAMGHVYLYQPSQRQVTL